MRRLILLLLAPLLLDVRPLRAEPGAVRGAATVAEGQETPLPPWKRYAEETAKRDVTGTVAYDALRAGTSWLVEQQGEDGSWSGGDGRATARETALALLALLGDGHSVRLGDHRDAVERGLAWLEGQLDQIEAPGPLSLALLASAESRHYGQGEVFTELEPAIERLLGMCDAQGFWRDAKSGEIDLEATAWAAQAIGTIGAGGGPVPKDPAPRTAEWMDAEVAKNGHFAEPGGAGHKERGTALTLLARSYLLKVPGEARHAQRQISRLVRKNSYPDVDSSDALYWFAATTALARVDEEAATEWWTRCADRLLDSQDRSSGSWPANTERSAVEQTALSVLTIEAAYRFEPVEVGRPEANAVGGAEKPSGREFGGRFGGPPPLAPRGGQGTAEPLENALAWLARQQRETGAIVGDDSDHPVACTGLALMAFLGDGCTPTRGPHRGAVASGLRWLQSQQDPETGRLGRAPSGIGALEHAIAAYALAESYYFTRSPQLKRSCELAVDYILGTHEDAGGWGYVSTADGTGTMSLTGWNFFALKAAEEAGLLAGDPRFQTCFEGVASLLDRTTAKDGRVGYEGGANGRLSKEAREALAAEALLVRFFLGQTPASQPVMTRHADRLLACLPEWSHLDPVHEVHYWYYATFAMFQVRGEHWERWNDAMKSVAIESQIQAGEDEGSWNPTGPWGQVGGRVYSTAMMALVLEVYFRYSRIRWR